MKVVVIDGQGGRMGQLFIQKAKLLVPNCELLAVGTNAIATASMLKAGADAGATGENPVIVACKTADIIIGPIGILAADSLYGEITPTMAVAIGQSQAKKLLLPVNCCNNLVVGFENVKMSAIIDEAVRMLQAIIT